MGYDCVYDVVGWFCGYYGWFVGCGVVGFCGGLGCDDGWYEVVDGVGCECLVDELFGLVGVEFC